MGPTTSMMKCLQATMCKSLSGNHSLSEFKKVKDLSHPEDTFHCTFPTLGADILSKCPLNLGEDDSGHPILTLVSYGSLHEPTAGKSFTDEGWTQQL